MEYIPGTFATEELFPLIQLPRKSEVHISRDWVAWGVMFPLIQLPRKSEGEEDDSSPIIRFRFPLIQLPRKSEDHLGANIPRGV